MEGLARERGGGGATGWRGLLNEADIRSKHDVIMRISKVVLDEIQRDDLAITDTLDKAVRSNSSEGNHLHRASNSFGSLLSDSTSGHRFQVVTDEGRVIPPFTVQDLKPYQVATVQENINPSQDVPILTRGVKPNKRPMSTGNMMSTSNHEASNKQDVNRTDVKTADSKSASSVLNLVPKMQKQFSREQKMFPHKMPMCDFAKDFSAESPVVKCEIPDDDARISEMVQCNLEETGISKQDPLSLLELVPDIPNDILNICWRYQYLDDEQLEMMRHYMIAKAFGWREKELEERTSV